MTRHTLWYAAITWIGLSTSVWAIDFQIALDPAQEVPPPTLGGATPSGTATVSVNTLTGDVNVTGSFAGLTGNATAAHIHGLAPPGVSAGVLVPLTTDAAASGNLTGGGNLSGVNLTGLLKGETYINIHTAMNGPGEIRGQIVDADILVYDLILDSASEVPPPNLGDATPSGLATVVVDTSSGLVEISGSYTGMTTDVTAAHLHGLAAPGVATGVIFGFETTGGTEGTFSGTGTLTAEHLAGLLAGQTYINVHTAQNGPGEIRAQVVPEPNSLLLLLLGLMPLLKRRR